VKKDWEHAVNYSLKKLKEIFPNLVYLLLITLCPVSAFPRIVECSLCFFQFYFFAQTFLLRKYIRINVSHYELGGTGIESQWAGLSSPIQNGSGAYPTSYSVGTGSFLGVNWSGYGIDHPSPSSHKVKEIVLLYFCSGFSWAVLG